MRFSGQNSRRCVVAERYRRFRHLRNQTHWSLFVGHCLELQRVSATPCRNCNLNERLARQATRKNTTARTALLALLCEIVSKSESRSRNQGIVYNARTTTMPTSVASTQTLLVAPALGRVRSSNCKEGIVDGTHSSALYRVLTTMTTAARASAAASRSLP